MPANLVFATEPGNTILPFVVDMYKARAKSDARLIIPCLAKVSTYGYDWLGILAR